MTKAEKAEYDRQYRVNNKEKLRDYERRRQQIRRDNRPRDPAKLKARWALRYAVRSGKILKPRYCQRCGAETQLHGHHNDYSQPYEVEWLCSSCHGKAHRCES